MAKRNTGWSKNDDGLFEKLRELEKLIRCNGRAIIQGLYLDYSGKFCSA